MAKLWADDMTTCELCGDGIPPNQAKISRAMVVSQYVGRLGKPVGYRWTLCNKCMSNRVRYDLGYPQDLGLFVPGMPLHMYPAEIQEGLRTGKIKFPWEQKKRKK